MGNSNRLHWSATRALVLLTILTGCQKPDELAPIRPVSTRTDAQQRNTQVAQTDPPQERVTGEDALAALKDELSEARRVRSEILRNPSSDEELGEIRRMSSWRQFEPRFLELARTYAGQPAAMQALQSLVAGADPGPVFDECLALIEQHHINDEGIAKLCRELVSELTPGIEPFLLAVAERHPNRDVRGLAYLSLARHLERRFDTAELAPAIKDPWLKRVTPRYGDNIVAWIRATDSAELLARIDVCCQAIISEYGDLDDDEYMAVTGRHRNLADAAKALSFSVHAVGSIAPEFVGEAADGSQLSLQDFRGRVVLLMFSANWCGPCKRMYGQLRELMDLYYDKQFSVLTVMADDEIDTVTKAVQSGVVTWPAIWDGADGPIASAWGVGSYPTIYLIDRDGRITSKGLREDPLDEEVARMLGISPEDRVKVDKRTRVRHLSLREKNISSEELLQLLEGYTQLRVLDLGYNSISDDALIHVQQLKNLETIRLEHTGITDKGLHHLESLQNLKTVHLYRGPGHRTTHAGRGKLKKAIPGLKISYTH